MKHRWPTGLTWVLLVIFVCGCGRFFPRADAGEDWPDRLRADAIDLLEPAALAPIIVRAAQRRAVLLGENTHGTAEYYAWRNAFSLALVREHGFRFIAVEGDGEAWYRLRPYLSGQEMDDNAVEDLLRGFDRWPPWLWANRETAALLRALRNVNQGRAPEEHVFVYGLDLYGAPAALRMLLDLVEPVDADLAAALNRDYDALRAYGMDFADYARAVARGERPTEGASQALERVIAWARAHPEWDEASRFKAEHLALIVHNAERHYRAMATHGPNSWNARADHFYQVFERLLDRYGSDARGIAWAHNTHIGDARATAMADRGQHNIGQLAREQMGAQEVYAVGFTGGRGRVIAARQWGGPWREKRKPDPRPGSLEDHLSRAEPERFALLFEDDPPPVYRRRVGHRAIGVLYRPELDHADNYVPTVTADRYDALLFFRETTPLDLLME